MIVLKMWITFKCNKLIVLKIKDYFIQMQQIDSFSSYKRGKAINGKREKADRGTNDFRFLS